MDKIKFDELWERIRLIAHEIKNTCQDGTEVVESKKDELREEYNLLRIGAGKVHLRDSVNIEFSVESTRMDRHKVASCMAGAILKVGILSQPKNIDPKGRKMISYFANETLAAFSGLAIVKAFIRADKNNEIGYSNEILEKKDKFLEEGFIFPSPTQDDFLPWLIYAFSDSKNTKYNVMAFSNIFYLLEAYTFSQIEAVN